jgi:hypothetical protein
MRSSVVIAAQLAVSGPFICHLGRAARLTDLPLFPGHLDFNQQGISI